MKKKSWPRINHFWKRNYISFFSAFFLFPVFLTSNLFFEEQLPGWFFYSGLSIGLLLYLLYTFKGTKNLELQLPDIIVLSYFTYIFLHAVFLHRFEIINKFQIIFFALPFYFLARRKATLNVDSLGRILLFLCIFQLAIVAAQYSGLVGNSSDLFPVGGSLGNPNVLGAFLALAFPFMLYLSFAVDGRVLRMSALLVAVFSVLLLIALKSRSALLALVSGGIVFYFNGKMKYKMLLAGLLFLFATVLVLWEAESSLGRCLIWRISFNAALGQSFWGAGFDGFTAAYLPAQADFFAQNHNPRLEWVSGQPQWAYNELLEHWIEGGIPGLLFYVLVYLAPLFYLLFRRKTKTIRTVGDRAVLYALWNYVLISLTNFTGTVFPLVMLYFVFLGFASRKAALHFHFGMKLPIMLVPLWLLFAIFFLFNTSVYLPESLFLRLLSQRSTISDTDYSKLKTLAWGYPEYTRLQGLLAHKAMMRGRPDSAYFFLNRNRQPVHELNTQLLKVQALLEMRCLAEAAALSSRLCRQAPNRIVPLYYLFRAELLEENKDKALALAKALIAFQPKVENQASMKAKAEAMNYLMKQEYERKLNH